MDCFLSSIYDNLYGRTPDAAGLAYWAAALDNGIMSRNVALEAIKNGAQGADAEMIANKAEVGLYYASKGLSNYFSLSDITDDPTTVETAKISHDGFRWKDHQFLPT